LDSAVGDYRSGVRGGGSCISDAVRKVGAARMTALAGE
jgi:hypothetical protein